MLIKVIREGVEVQTLDLREWQSRSGKPVLVVGRSPEADVRLDDRAVGREHAVISIHSRGLSIQKKSKFGRLAVNDREATGGALKAGDVISIAEYRLRIEDAESREEQAVAPEGQPEVVASPGPALAADAAPLDLGLAPAEVPAPAPAEIAVPMDAGVAVVETPTAQLASPVTLGTDAESSANPADTASSSGSGSAPALEGGAAGQPVSGDFASGGGGDDKTSVTQRSKMIARLIFKPGEANVEELELRKPEISVGRSANCDVVINDKKASRKHMIIRRSGISFVAQDLGSANGTFVNGQPITTLELSGDDVLRIGETEFTFRAMSQEFFEQQQGFMEVPAHEVSEEPTPVPSELQGGALSVPPVGGMPAAGGPPVTGGIPGLGAATPPGGDKSLLGKFKALPPRRRMVIVAIAVLGLLFLFSEEQKPKSKGKGKPGQQKVAAVVDKATADFNALPPEKRQFVDNTYNLAMDSYKAGEYEKTLHEIEKILQILPGGFKDTTMLKTFAQRGYEMEKSKAEERRRKEEEERLRKEITELVAQAQDLVDKKKFDEARDVFAKVFERDPENATILRLKQQIEEEEARMKAEEEARREREKKHQELLALIREGRKLLGAGKYYEVMDRMQDAPTIGYNDPKLLGQARGLIVEAKQQLKEKTRPHLEEGRQSLDAGDYPKARDAFYRALKVDPRNKEAKAGIARIREILHEKSKHIYTEAVILEGVSDFQAAKAKYKECLDQSMPDDIYRGRCTRKFKRFEMMDRVNASIGGGAASSPDAPVPTSPQGDPQMPTLPTPGPMEPQ